MKAFCVDTSGFSNPLEYMPQDIHPSVWAKVMEIIARGEIAVTTEIYQEMTHIPGALGDCIKQHKGDLVMEIAKGHWDWQGYVSQTNAMNAAHHAFISEYSGGSARTISLNDLSIVALAKTLGIPLVSMEVSAKPSVTKRRIPDVCQIESVKHISFSDFLRANNIRV